MIKLQAKSRIINYDEKLSLIRECKPEYVDGKIVKDGSQTINFKANVQPFNGRDLLLVPEGDRYKEMYWVFTDTVVQTNDFIVRLGLKFQVQSVENWGSYTRSRMVRIDVGTNAN